MSSSVLVSWVVRSKPDSDCDGDPRDGTVPGWRVGAPSMSQYSLSGSDGETYG